MSERAKRVIVGTPKVLSPEEGDSIRADNLNRNFNDSWRYFEAFRKEVENLKSEMDAVVKNIQTLAAGVSEEIENLKSRVDALEE